MPEHWRVVVGADEAGRRYKDQIADDLRDDPRVSSVVDLGVFDAELRPYPRVALEAAQLVASGAADRAVLICGTGIGMAISANKVPGIRATVVADSYSCERSVLSNDCQVMTMGERVVGLELARRLASEWLSYRFDPSSPSNDKVAEITEFERLRPSETKQSPPR